MENEPETLFVAGVVKGINEVDCSSKTVTISTNANNIEFVVRVTDRLYQKIKVGKRYLIVYLSCNPSKIIALWNNPSAKKIVKTSDEIKKFGTIIQRGKVRKV